MKNLILIISILLSNLSFCQEKFDNEKVINSIEKYNTQEIITKIKKLNTVYGTFTENVEIYGTLITPKTKFEKIIVIVSGTGKTSQYAHNYLSEYLLDNNIGVFRFDKRGLGKSSGKFSDFFQIYSNDFYYIFQNLRQNKNFKTKKIGVLAHSLGGIASIQTIEKDLKPDFLIQWSTPIGKPRQITKYQIIKKSNSYDNTFIANNIEGKIKLLDFVYQIVDKNPKSNAWELSKIAKKKAKKFNLKKKSYDNFFHPNEVEFARIDNTKTYQNIDFPTLVIIGEKDILVNPEQSKVELEKIGNSNIEFKQIDGLNHFMTKKGIDWKTNEIYNVDLAFKKYIVKWINNIK